MLLESNKMFKLTFVFKLNKALFLINKDAISGYPDLQARNNDVWPNCYTLINTLSTKYKLLTILSLQFTSAPFSIKRETTSL